MTAVIADDEAPARRIIRQYLEAFPQVTVAAEARNGAEAVEAVRAHAPDLLFLDIQMPGQTGFEALETLAASGEALPRVVFSTAYDQHALRAFEVGAVDYLLKPYDRARFERALRRLLDDQPVPGALDGLLAALQERATPAPRYADQLLVREGVRVHAVPVADLAWAEAAGDYTHLHTLGGQTHLAAERLGQMAERLDPARFLRVHRSALVALGAIAALEPDGSGGYHASLTNGATLRVSRTYAPALREHLV